MKTWKKAGSVLLALALLAGLLPFRAAAAAVCEDGTHTPGTTLYPANWNSTTGGYGYDYYKCTVCDTDCDARGYQMQHVAPENGCSGGKKCHVPGTAFTTCSGTTGYYYCASCQQIVDANGTLADISGLGGHDPDLSNLQLADYNPCTGGHQSSYYLCKVCSQACDANGDGAPYTAGTGVHDPDLATLYPADWNSTTGGYGDDYYKCKDCGAGCDKNGQTLGFVSPNNGCSGGKKCHLPGTQQFPADYSVCSGGYQTDYYRCTSCENGVDAQGTLLKWYAPTASHTLGERNDPNYTLCGGGFQVSWYECTVCGACIDEDGNSVPWSAPTAGHTLGERNDPNYTPCGGGFQVSWYECTICRQPLDDNGNYVEWVEPTSSHVLGERNDSNYTPCGGGFQVDWYDCTVCHQPLDDNGNYVDWMEPTAGHTISRIAAAAPTYEADGNIEYWHCTVCGLCFADAGGSTPIDDLDSVILPKLEPDPGVLTPTVEPGLSEVPESVTGKYPTVSDVKQAMADAAYSASASLVKANADSVLMDVTLQRRNPDGTLTPISPEDFPEEGVDMLLPYPAGTDQSFTFVITHMITHGARAGEIEVLASTPEADGIRVHFTSMSPVCITYQKADTSGGDQTPAATPGTTTPGATGSSVGSVNTGDGTNVLLWGGVLLLCGLAFVLFLPKKKRQ